MSEEMEKNTPAVTEPAAEKPQGKKSLTGRIDNTDRFFLDPNGLEASNYTGDEVSERDYRPIRRSTTMKRKTVREGRNGRNTASERSARYKQRSSFLRK